MDCRWMMVVLSFIICHLSFISANAQSVTAKIDPIEMMMGEQAQVTLTVQAPEGATVEWPKLQPRQQLVEGVEVLNTQRTSSSTMLLTITSFDGKLYRSSAMSNGKAVVFLYNLAPGHYMFNASYDGDDYIVYSNEFDIRVSPKITADTYFRTGEKKSITLSVPKDCGGVMTVTIDGGKPHNVKVTNGKATFSLSNLEEGYYDVEVRFKGENGFEDYDFFDIEVLPAKIKIQAKDVNVLYKHSAKYKVKLFGNDAKPLKNKWVKFKIGKKTYKAKTNSKGIATIKLKKLKAKTHKVTVSYGKVKVTKKIRVKMLKLDVSKSKTKVKLTAKLYKKIKGKTVKFKVGSKKYSVKTNSKGIAKLTVKMKTSSKVKFQAKCLKSTVVVQK